MQRSHLFLILIIVGIIVVRMCAYTVDQTEQAIVVQLGKPIEEIKGPGLHFKLPFVQSVIRFERRLLDYDAAPREIITKDKKTLVVDNYARWRIVDPLQFYRTVRTESIAQSRLDDIVYSIMREELGTHTLSEIISVNRGTIMDEVEKKSTVQTRDFGIEIVDVRIKRADLPPENERFVFNRMKAERQRAAKRYRSEGEEAAMKIRAEADRKKAVILAQAYAEAEKKRGEGDAAAIAIYAEAYQEDMEFYAFQRSLEAYRRALLEKNKVVLTPENTFLHYLDEAPLKPALPAPEAEEALPER
ncbi:MAG: protease modulator HflC [Deltaproteobacteria bacterium]|nr:MAG: protease modulator HflC [Deltaproteobacteria bacterium]